MMLGSLTYYLYTFSFPIAIFVFVLSSLLSWFVYKRLPSFPFDTNISWKWDLKKTSLTIIPVFLALFSIFFLVQHQITDAVRSPWEKIPPFFFVLYGILSFCTLLIPILTKTTSWIYTNILIPLFLFLSLGLAAILFPLGFGYDPLIHQAAEQYIVDHGHIEPKTPYYLGQYVLVAGIHDLTGIPITFIDSWLLLILSILFLPWCLTRFIQTLSPKSLLYFAPVLLLLFPTQAFTFTTPQNLSYLFLLCTLFLFPYTEKHKEFRIVTLLLAGATASIHPITGAPLLLSLVLYYVPITQWKKLYFLGIICISSLLIPFLFFVKPQTGISVQWQHLFSSTGMVSLFKMPLLYLVPNYHVLLEFIYFFGNNATLFILLLCALGYWLCTAETKQKLAPLFGLSLIYLLNAIFLSNTTTFSQLIFYEQQNYATRLQFASLLGLIPSALLVLQNFLQKGLQKNLRFPLLVLVSIGLTTSLYLRYPKTDDYVTDRGYNVSQTDLDAVQWIAQDAQDIPFVVIADQSIGTAAIKAFGFKQYFGPHFYYSIPTGSPLYDVYLTMVYSPEKQKEAIQKAFDLVPQAQELYFVLHKYWWRSDKVHTYAQENLEEAKIFNQGEVRIYKIQKPQ